MTASADNGAATETVYELDLPWTTPPLSLNHSYGHWRTKAKKIRAVREAGCLLAKQAGIGPCSRVRVTLHYRPRDRRTRDEENSIPTLKALCDGLVDAGIVPDDAPQYMTKAMPVLHEAASVSKEKSRLWLVVEPIEENTP